MGRTFFAIAMELPQWPKRGCECAGRNTIPMRFKGGNHEEVVTCSRILVSPERVIVAAMDERMVDYE